MSFLSQVELRNLPMNSRKQIAFMAKRYVAKMALCACLQQTGIRAPAFNMVSVEHNAMGKPCFHILADPGCQPWANLEERALLTLSDEKHLAFSAVTLKSEVL